MDGCILMLCLIGLNLANKLGENNDSETYKITLYIVCEGMEEKAFHFSCLYV